VAVDGRYLITADVAKSVCVYHLPRFSRILCLSFRDDRVEAFYEQPRSHVLAILVSKLTLGNDEDEDTAEEVVGPYMVLLPRPNAKPRIIDVDHFATIACGKNKDEPCGR
jgi:hypothetical protein